MAEFLMPKLGADMTAGTLVSWRVKPGDTVRRGDIVAEVETDKGVIDVETFHGGVIRTLLVQPGAHVPVGTALAQIEGDQPETVTSPSATAPATEATAGRLRVSPSARALARQLNVDLATIQGSGREGAITREDIERAAQAEPTAAPVKDKDKEDRQSRMRQSIAAAMSRSKREIPHYYLSTTVDLYSTLTWLSAENERRAVPDRFLPGVLFLKAVAVALKQVPELNAMWSENRVVLCPGIHVGVAITLRQGGLVAPALHDTDQQTLDNLMQNFRDLVNRARTGALRGSELSEPTITVTSMGDQGVETVFGIINPPQVAIVGFGKIVERPWVVNGQIVPRPVVTVSLSADHRVTDGHRGAQFLAAVDRLLQEPGQL